MSQEIYTDERGPEKVVILDGELTTELLQTGTVETTLFRDVGGELEREDVEVLNKAGPHPWYAGTSPPDDEPDDRPLWKRAIPHVVTWATALAVFYAVVNYVPMGGMTINGEPVPWPPGPVPVAIVFAFAVVVYLAMNYAPGVILPRRSW